jgi:hypothetical protein
MAHDSNYDDGVAWMQHSINVDEQRQGPEQGVNGFSEIESSFLSQGYKKWIVESSRRSESEESGHTFLSFRNVKCNT